MKYRGLWTIAILGCCLLFLFFFNWHYSPLWALVCQKTSFHFFLSVTSALHLLIPSTWRSLSTSSFHPFLGLPFRLVPSSSWVKIFLGILSSSILSRWPNQLILCAFIHFTIFSPLLISSSSRETEYTIDKKFMRTKLLCTYNFRSTYCNLPKCHDA